jgi:enterochelin esterase family protein
MKHPFTISRAVGAALTAAAFLATGSAAFAQQAELNSHEVNADGSITFRYLAPAAKTVTLDMDYAHVDVALAKGADGVWVLTTKPLEPALHMYDFKVDGVQVFDPMNGQIDGNFVFRTNMVRVPAKGPLPWDVNDVPHGVVHHHVYRSASITGLENGAEDYYVYTPPGYDASGSTRYPVLYLLHGWSSRSGSWLEQGEVNFILDNLIAQGKAVPMIVVMPLGYGDISFVTGGFGAWGDDAKILNNVNRFTAALLSEILPQVEATYRVAGDRDHRAIAGLSMGGGQSLSIGLNHQDQFAWIGGFSPAVVYKNVGPAFPALDSGKGAPLRLLWVSCGTSEQLLEPVRSFEAWIKDKGFQPVVIETPGIHNWPVWRDNLVHFAPLLFKPSSP